MGFGDFFKSTIKVSVAGQTRELDLSQIGKYCKPLDGRAFRSQAALESAINFMAACNKMKYQGEEYRKGVSKNAGDIVNTLKKNRQKNDILKGTKFKTEHFQKLQEMYETKYLPKYDNEIKHLGNIVSEVNACIVEYNEKKHELY